jgi:four helix bundle protein
MFRFEELEIWKKGICYAEKCYSIASKFPDIERYALSDQLRRAAVSIPTNIAEGSGGTEKEFCSFLSIAARSCLETVSLLTVAEKQKYITMIERIELYGAAEELVRKIRAMRRFYLDRQ